ncbi:type II toxin-antitoxin system prevent-host-death family antitoxin [Pseudonocardia xinjiangensis]|uniref:Type II toxin-antitoxin system prevent-host-death family antitoxin n=1 Tax=Pseudonocardia xinjiangensis TaxID=75289 RepID=A0ABX1RP36_9PSEU|nr:type II toxin-antitoxin system prevent-host-death family antitoxin [Pseudonocardia xinjiangensis]
MADEVVASRELRNDTAGLLRRVEAGERLTIPSTGGQWPSSCRCSGLGEHGSDGTTWWRG